MSQQRVLSSSAPAMASSIFAGPARRSAGCNVTGDLNGDCLFNVVDVRYLLVFLAERGAGFTTGTGQLILGRLQSHLGFFRRRDVD